MKAAMPHKTCFIGAGHAPRAHSRPRMPAPPRLTTAQDVKVPSAPASTIRRPKEGDPAAAGVPRVLVIDSDPEAANAMSSLLTPEASVVHVLTMAAARSLLQAELFSLAILDPVLSDGDGRELMPVLSTTPVLLYSARQPDPRVCAYTYLPKPWTSQRQLWSTISRMLGLASPLTAGD